MTVPPATFTERHRLLRETLRQRRDAQERLSWVVEQARHRPPFPAEWRTDAHIVPGCAARLWLAARRDGEGKGEGEDQDRRCRFACDSDSAILKAAAGLLCDLYDGLTAAEIVAEEPTFFADAGLLHQFTENRQRTIHKVRAAIREFATAAAAAPAA